MQDWNNTIKTAVVDDDVFIHTQIKGLIAAYFTNEERIKANEPIYFSDGAEILEYFRKGKKVDIVFLDIEMSSSNGIEIASLLREIYPEIIIIFVSGHAECVFDAFRCEALHFIVKPIKEDEFNEIFVRAMHKYSSANRFLNLKWKYERAKVSVNDVLYIESYRGKLTVHTLDGNYEVIGKMKDIFNFLEPHGFMRIHHGYIVNMQHITHFDSDSITLPGGERVMISIRKRAEALETYDRFLQKWKW